MGSYEFWFKKCRCDILKSMNSIFYYLLGIILEIYVDDVIVNSNSMDSHLANLCLALEMMRRYGLKINLVKCVFGVSLVSS
jgi:predicted metalloprotease with PDZ domain